MSTPTRGIKKKKSIDINPNSLRRGRSGGLLENFTFSYTPLSTRRAPARKVTFSPKEPIVLPELLSIPEEIYTETNIIPNVEHTNSQINNLEESHPSTPNQPLQTQTNGKSINLIEFNSSESSEYSSILEENSPFQSKFARRLSFGKIPGYEEENDEIFNLSFLFRENEDSNMAIFKLNEIVNIIPSYDGKEEQLKLYVKSAKLYYDGVTEAEKPIVLNILLSKLSGKAVEAIGNVDEINTLATLTERLNEKIPEALSYTLAHTQLQKIIQTKNESISDYAKRFETGLNKLKKAALQTNGGMEITESIGKTLFIQNMTNANMQIIAASSNAETTKDIIKYVKEKDLILGKKPTQTETSGTCGFCSKPNHTENECNKRKYAQKLLKITPGDSKNQRTDGRNGRNENRDNYGRNYKSSNGTFSGGRSNGNRQFNDGDTNRSNQNRPQNNDRSNNGNYRNRGNGNNQNNHNDNSENGGNSNERNNQNYGNRNYGNNRNTENTNRNNASTNNQRYTLNSQNTTNIPEDDLQVPLHELQAHAQYHAQNSGN